MLWWCFSLAAVAGTPEPLWTMPASGTVISRGLTAGDFDSDGVTDFAALVAVSDIDYRLAYTVTGVYDEVLPLVDPLPFRLDAVDLDQDGRDALAMHDPEDEESGALFLADIAETAPGSPKPEFTLILEGSFGDLLASDFATVDTDADGTLDLLVGTPGRDGAYRIAGTLAGDFQLNELEPVGWEGPDQATLRGFGAGVAVRERAGAAEVAIARCAVEAGACANAGLAVRPLSELAGVIRLSESDLGDAPSEPLRSLETLADADGDGVAELVWVGEAQKIVLGSASGDAALISIEADGDDVVTNAGLSGGQLWVRDGGTVYVVDRFDQGGAVADIAADVFALGGAALGLALADAGDQDGDGCDDLIASAAATDTVYLLASPCTAPDTVPDTADSGDSGGGDTAPGAADTGARCLPGLGWYCGGSASSAAWLGLVGLLWRRQRQRTQTAKRYRYE